MRRSGSIDDHRSRQQDPHRNRPGHPNGRAVSRILDSGGDVIGVDWRVHLDEAWAMIGHDRAVQGNMDPLVLFAPLHEIERRVEDILRRAGNRPGHIFNLGHGILPTTPTDHVAATIDMVHKLSQR